MKKPKPNIPDYRKRLGDKPKEDSPLVKKTKGVIASASRMPGALGKYAQALSVGADLGTGLGKAIRGDKKGAHKDFGQAAIGFGAFTPLKGTKFFKASNIGIDALEISEVLPTGDARGKKKSRGVTVSYSKGGKMPKK
jgi:hypothetical protein